MQKIYSKIGTKGFTLIEVLIVIGIIAILAAIVLVAVNPAKNFREASNTQRTANVNALMNAIGQYTVDSKGVFPPGLTSNIDPKKLIAGSAVSNAMTDFSDFCNALVPKFIGALPVDPNLPDQTITASECGDTNATTGYEIYVKDGHITISAPETIDVETGGAVSEDISVTR